MGERGDALVEVYDLGLRLKNLRRNKHLSQKQAAQRLGISRSTVSAYECNTKTPGLEILIKMATLYDTTLDEIAGREKGVVISLNGLAPNRQKMIIDVVDRMKQEFLQHP